MNLDLLNKLKDLAIISHYSCEDQYYSCPKSPEGCADSRQGDECNCGAEKHNQEVEEVYKQLMEA